MADACHVPLLHQFLPFRSYPLVELMKMSSANVTPKQLGNEEHIEHKTNHQWMLINEELSKSMDSFIN